MSSVEFQGMGATEHVSPSLKIRLITDNFKKDGSGPSKCPYLCPSSIQHKAH